MTIWKGWQRLDGPCSPSQSCARRIGGIQMYELETVDGDILTFNTAGEVFAYVAGRMGDKDEGDGE